MSIAQPIALSPLTAVHERARATLETVNGWQVARRYPDEPAPGGNAVVDLSHWPTFEINGPQTGELLKTTFKSDVPLRSIQIADGCHIYRSTDRRAIIFDTAGRHPVTDSAVDVTGGWATLALIGPDAFNILSKVTAVDLRVQTLPPTTCCQGPVFGVNTLFGRFQNRFDLHVCTDSAEFFLEVLMDAGREFNLKPAGTDFHRRAAGDGA